MRRYLIIIFCVAPSMIGSTAYTQTISTARAIGLAAYGPSVKDSRGFGANPAGLVGMRDWDFNTSTYVPASAGGFVFHGFSIGKRFLGDDAVAIQYSPGVSLEFILPTDIVLGTSSLPTSFDKRISYNERFSLGYAHRFSDKVSIGVGGWLREEKMTDTQYQLNTQDTIFSVSTLEYKASSWNFDLGLQWKPWTGLTLSVLGKNLFRLQKTDLPEDLRSFSLPHAKSLSLGAAFDIMSALHVAMEAGTEKHGTAGCEWEPGLGLTARGGAYLGVSEQPFVYAVGAGIGWSYGVFELEAGYLRFLNQSGRMGSSSASQFDPGTIRDIDFNRYTRDRLTLSAKIIFGSVREALALIESVEMFGGIYPSSYEALAYRPIGKAKVKNISGRPIQAKAKFYLEKYMDAPTETQSVYIPAGGEQEIPLTAVFNEQVRTVSQMTIREGNVYITATSAEEYDDRYQTRVLIHGKNDWDGDVFSLRYFVTPNDPDIIRYGRDILLKEKDSLDALPKELRVFSKAKRLFDAFADKLMYVNDPKQSGDYVQYPSETLELRGGDCDDMTVWYSSLLNSTGISTAFIDVIPPNNPGASHIYMLFDTGIEPKFGNYIAENPKRYVVRKNPRGAETIWVPIETTAITRGFDEAWSTGAQEYFDDVEVGLCVVKGWVRIIDVY